MMLKKVLLLSLCGLGLPIQAQITLDGALGPKITLPRLNYQIDTDGATYLLLRKGQPQGLPLQ